MFAPIMHNGGAETFPFAVHVLPSNDDPIDLLVANVGYEKRSMAVTERMHERCGEVLISAYSTRKVESYRSNLTNLSKMGYLHEIEADHEFVDSFNARFNAALDRLGRHARVCIDISSASRPRIAAMVTSALQNIDRCTVDFVYVPALFDEPSDDSNILRAAGPVTPDFAGMSLRNELPICAIIGLGFEELEAMAAYQYLDPKETWLFVPVDVENEYMSVVKTRNADVLRIVGESNTINYAVFEPAWLYSFLESLTMGYRGIARPVFVPLGPKIFALVALLVSARFAHEIPVWRFSSDQESLARDVRPSDSMIGLRVTRQ